MYNKTIHFIGISFGVFGALMLVKMAGLGDLGGSCSDIARYGVAGLTALVGGMFLTRWTI